MQEQRPSISEPRIVVLGSLNADLVVAVPHLPVPGETVIGGDLHVYAGGKGANQAVAAARLGVKVVLVGRVGEDANGAFLLKCLQADGVDCRIERDAQHATGVALIEVDSRGQNCIAVAPGANGAVGPDEVALAAAELQPGSVLLLQLEVPLAAVVQAVDAARSRAARVILNAAPARSLPPDLLTRLDALLVNEIEASTILGCEVRDVESAKQAVGEARHHGIRVVAITLGALGAVVGYDGQVMALPALPISAADTTGAGDAFVGAFAAALSAGLDYDEATRLGNAAGAAAALVPGAQSSFPRRQDLERLFSIHWPDISISREQGGQDI